MWNVKQKSGKSENFFPTNDWSNMREALSLYFFWIFEAFNSWFCWWKALNFVAKLWNSIFTIIVDWRHKIHETFFSISIYQKKITSFDTLFIFFNFLISSLWCLSEEIFSSETFTTQKTFIFSISFHIVILFSSQNSFEGNFLTVFLRFLTSFEEFLCEFKIFTIFTIFCVVETSLYCNFHNLLNESEKKLGKRNFLVLKNVENVFKNWMNTCKNKNKFHTIGERRSLMTYFVDFLFV